MQSQPAARTVASELERVFSSLLREDIRITAAGRTDTGVHATGQVVSFTTQTAFPFARLAIAANSDLPKDVSIREAHVCERSFSARFSASERTYVYAFYNLPSRSAMFDRYAYHVWRPFDIERFRAAALPLLGEHDFRSFCSTVPAGYPTTRTLRKLEIEAMGGGILRVEIRADGFLHRMVRTIVGTLLECATGRRDPRSIAAVLDARDRTKGGLTAPAHGLYLAGVRYGDGFDSFKEPPVTARAP